MPTRRALLHSLLLLAFSHPALAAQSSWDARDHLRVRLLSADDRLGQAENFKAGLELELQPGWHSYWRMPGEGGLPPAFDWSQSTNVKDVTVGWPAPKRFETAGMYSFGYADHAILPVSVTRKDAKSPVGLRLKADIMVCEATCVPQEFSLSLDLPAADAATRSPEAAILAKADRLVPKAEDAGLRVDSAVLGPSAVVVQAWSNNGYKDADLFLEVDGDELYMVGKPEITVDAKDGRKATMRIAAPEGVDNLANILMHRSATVTLVNGRSAIEKKLSF